MPYADPDRRRDFQREYQRAWARLHPEQRRAWHRRWVAAHPEYREREAARRRAKYVAHPRRRNPAGVRIMLVGERYWVPKLPAELQSLALLIREGRAATGMYRRARHE